MNTKTEIQKKPDRVLGDEWENWTGDLDESRSYEETARLFTIYAALALFILLGCLAFILYMIEPRLSLFNPVLVSCARILIITVII